MEKRPAPPYVVYTLGSKKGGGKKGGERFEGREIPELPPFPASIPQTPTGGRGKGGKKGGQKKKKKRRGKSLD